MAVERVSFPLGKINMNTQGSELIKDAYLQWNPSYENKLNINFDNTQKFIDNKVIMYLQEYVSWKTGTQAKSIRLSSKPGSGEVWIGVPYAHYQAYSGRITKQNGKRGKYPFERMKADKLETIKAQTLAYSRRLNG